MSMHPDLEPWVTELAPRLGLDPDEVPLPFLLDVARDVAHGAVRPGAPVSTFMIGLALGRADIATTDDAQQAVVQALEAWESRDAARAGADAGDEATTSASAEADAIGIGGDDDGSAA